MNTGTAGCAAAADTAPWFVLLAAGRGTRLAAHTGCAKQFLRYKNRPLYWQSVRTCAATQRFGGLVLVFPPETMEENAAEARELAGKEGLTLPLRFAKGGARRQDSVCNGLQHVPESAAFVCIHDAARPFFSEELVHTMLARLAEGATAVIPGLAVKDTIKQADSEGRVLATPDRAMLRAVQTPQGFDRALLQAAHAALNTPDNTVTDDASLMEAAGHTVWICEGEEANVKITTAADLRALDDSHSQSDRHAAARNEGHAGSTGESRDSAQGAPASPSDAASAAVSADRNALTVPCTGWGYDVHRYGGTRPLVLGGIAIDTTYTIAAHSDGDVLLHALMDALLGMIGKGDIGELFPDSDPAYDGASSVALLNEVMGLVRKAHVQLTHADVTIIAQKPRLKPWKQAIRSNLARLLGLDESHVNVKATTEEGLGFTGELLGIKACATVAGLARQQ